MLNIDRFESLIQEEMQTARVPGVAVAVVLNKEIIYAKGFGVTAVGESGVPVTAETLFPIASCTKPLTGTLLMRLVQAGQVELDVPIRQFLPDFRLRDESAAERITLRMLLSHQAGFRDGGTFIGRADSAGLADFASEQLSQEELFAPPGKLYCYSNRNSSLAGYLAERVTGKAFARLMEEELFIPLGMNSSTLDPARAECSSVARAHDLRADGAIVPVEHVLQSAEDAPALGVLSNVLDMARFAIMHINEGQIDGQAYLHPRWVAEMHKPHADLFSGIPSAYGLHFILSYYKDILQVRHFGGLHSFCSALVTAPQEQVAVVVLHNRDLDVMKIVNRAFDDLLPAAKELSVNLLPKPLEIDRPPGFYLGEKIGLLEIASEAGSLRLVVQGESFTMRHVRDELYLAVDGEGNEVASVGFIPEAEGPTRYLMLNKTPLKRIDYDPAFVLGREQLTRYAGTYSHCGVLTLHVTVEGDSLLRFQDHEGSAGLLMAVDHERFVGDDFPYAEFYFDEEGAVSGLGFQGGWRFEKVGATC
ncbi:serine hydrolase [Tumebacillus lipolyticus]|uniref:Serine hydrolase n=1 Tax=Tumebacillus lipolyticus TaxID=1280370 RepID=A0ABW4ZRL3_9BACL